MSFVCPTQLSFCRWFQWSFHLGFFTHITASHESWQNGTIAERVLSSYSFVRNYGCHRGGRRGAATALEASGKMSKICLSIIPQPPAAHQTYCTGCNLQEDRTDREGTFCLRRGKDRHAGREANT